MAVYPEEVPTSFPWGPAFATTRILFGFGVSPFGLSLRANACTNQGTVSSLVPNGPCLFDGIQTVRQSLLHLNLSLHPANHTFNLCFKPSPFFSLYVFKKQIQLPCCWADCGSWQPLDVPLSEELTFMPPSMATKYFFRALADNQCTFMKTFLRERPVVPRCMPGWDGNSIDSQSAIPLTVQQRPDHKDTEYSRSGSIPKPRDHRIPESCQFGTAGPTDLPKNL